MIISDPEDKVCFKCPRCGNRRFEKVELFEFKMFPRQNEYTALKDADVYRCHNCKHVVTKDQVR